MMRRLKLAGAALLLTGTVAAVQAETFDAFSAPGFTTETSSLAGYYFEPIAAPGSDVASYSVLSTASGFSTTATITFSAPTTSYTFLWGSPDSYNFVSDGTVTVNGASVGTPLYTFTDPVPFSSLTFSTTGVAFELAEISAVPEPSSYMLMLAGISSLVAFNSIRKKRGV